MHNFKFVEKTFNPFCDMHPLKRCVYIATIFFPKPHVLSGRTRNDIGPIIYHIKIYFALPTLIEGI